MTHKLRSIKAFSAAIAILLSLSLIQTGCESSGGGSDSSSSGGVNFSKLNWTFGGADCSGAVEEGVYLSGLSLSPSGLSFTYDTNLSAWGMSDGDANAYACFFVKRSDGTWVGGKFDWISSSRTSRDFAGHVPGYAGWTLANVPNPCDAAFVIVKADGSRRSNVVTGTWTR